MTTISTLFSGGEGVGVGARQAGLTHLWGVEYDDQIASVARLNGFNTLTGNVMDRALMLSLPRPDVIHASPVCKNASNAKADGEESPEDIASADATCVYIDHFRPDIFTLENVYGYRTFTAFAHIMECLNRNGYRFDYWHLNAANFGVPQTRQRLILVARLHGKPRRPVATHAEPSKLAPLFDERQPWIGWYKAIEDLIDTLPEMDFPPLITEKIFNEDRDCELSVVSFLVDTQNTHGTFPTIRLSKEPAPVISEQTRTDSLRAFIYNDEIELCKNIRLMECSLMRIQSFPDSYILPAKVKLACTVIGNAVPPLLYQRVIEANQP
jgi:DNA (cytosine-5)-methyltransferase 1